MYKKALENINKHYEKYNDFFEEKGPHPLAKEIENSLNYPIKEFENKRKIYLLSFLMKKTNKKTDFEKNNLASIKFLEDSEKYFGKEINLFAIKN